MNDGVDQERPPYLGYVVLGLLFFTPILLFLLVMLGPSASEDEIRYRRGKSERIRIETYYRDQGYTEEAASRAYQDHKYSR